MAQTFRGDIQGLRAVAVLTVVAAHAGVPFLAGIDTTVRFEEPEVIEAPGVTHLRYRVRK